MSDDPRCALTELLKVNCAHCRGLTYLPRKADRLGPAIVAKYRGRCVECDGDLDPGDTIRYTEDSGGYLCVECAG